MSTCGPLSLSQNPLEFFHTSFSWTLNFFTALYLLIPFLFLLWILMWISTLGHPLIINFSCEMKFRHFQHHFKIRKMFCPFHAFLGRPAKEDTSVNHWHSQCAKLKIIFSPMKLYKMTKVIPILTFNATAAALMMKSLTETLTPSAAKEKFYSWICPLQK